MKDKPESGTALVTGSSSGLGEAFARRLAAERVDLILVARREERLRALAEELNKTFGVHVEVWPADLSTDEGIAGVAERIASRSDLTMLINNAGFGHGGSYARIDVKPQMDMIHVHVVATARLTKAVLPQMIERDRGAIINVSSVAAFAILAKRTMYNSTKAWINAFTRSIAEELRGTNVRIQALCPGFTVTGFHGTPELRKFHAEGIPKFLWGSADKVVQASLKALRRNKTVYVPGLLNRVMSVLPRMPFGQALSRLVARRKV
jgi:short-subunit dehydrogenase